MRPHEIEHAIFIELNVKGAHYWDSMSREDKSEVVCQVMCEDDHEKAVEDARLMVESWAHLEYTFKDDPEPDTDAA